MHHFFEDTIAAISTAMSPSGLAIIRLSGEHAIQIADRIYHGKRQKKLVDQEANTIHYGHVADPDTGEEIDEVLVMLLRAPHSFTGENTVEINCHGGILVAKSILDAAIHAGARPAEPGEFSKRAFLNGKMDLSQAEAVMNVIHAKNQYALKSSFRQLKGSLSGKIQEIRNTLIHELAFIETALDDPEHFTLEEYPQQLLKLVSDQKEKIGKLAETSESGRLIQEGIKTVIIGKPNAGKSSLLNVLLGEDRAIVTDIEGTTRDVLEDQVNIRGITLRILDTAGIRDTNNQIEKIGVERSKQHAEDADLLLYVVDSSVPLDENDKEIMRLTEHKHTIVLLNKNDLETVTGRDELSMYMDAPIISVSAKSEDGIETLEHEIEKIFFDGKLNFNDEIYITNSRHRAALEEAIENLSLVEESIKADMPEDFYSIDLMAACDALGKITGQSIGEDLMNEIFSSFCLGK